MPLSASLEQVNRFISNPWFIFLALSLSLLLHAPFLNRPPESLHVWRQCNTLAMARNFFQEGMNPLKPKVDNRSFGDGVTGSQFPSYELLLASTYKITGEHFWVHRCFSLILYFLGALGMYFLLFYITKSKLMGSLALWGYLWSPELFYHGINALPDTLALPASIWGFYFALKWLDNKTIKDYLPTLFLLSLAGLTKVQFLVVGFPLAVYFLLGRKSFTKLKDWLLLIFLGACVLGLTYFWYDYAQFLSDKNGMHDFVTKPRAVSSMQDFWYILQKNLISDLPETLLNFSNFILFCVGIYAGFVKQKWKAFWFLPILLWAIGLLVYYFVGMNQMKAHVYYLMPCMPFLLVLAAWGGKYLAQKGKITLLLLLLAAQPILCSIRILPARWMKADKMMPKALYEKDSREKLSNAIPNDELCIVAIDGSKCIFLYMLNKKGVTTASAEELMGKTSWGQPFIEYYVSKGIRYMYLSQSDLQNDPRIAPFIESQLVEEAGFVLLKLKE